MKNIYDLIKLISNMNTTNKHSIESFIINNEVFIVSYKPQGITIKKRIYNDDCTIFTYKNTNIKTNDKIVVASFMKNNSDDVYFYMFKNSPLLKNLSYQYEEGTVTVDCSDISDEYIFQKSLLCSDPAFVNTIKFVENNLDNFNRIDDEFHCNYNFSLHLEHDHIQLSYDAIEQYICKTQ